MIDFVHAHFAKYPGALRRPPIVCADGTEYSVQASDSHYCSPQVNAGPYTAVEVWGPFTRYPEGWVSVEKINARIRRHGGVK